MRHPIHRRNGSVRMMFNRTTFSKILWVFGVLSIIGSPVRSAFQETLWGARPAAMGGAYTALANDANSPNYNPAGIAFTPRSEITIMYAQLFTGLDFQVGEETSRLGLGYFGYVPDIKSKKYGSFAFSWNNFVASNLLREDSFNFTYADSYQFRQFSNEPILAFGANLKFLRRSFSTDSRSDADPVFSGGRDADAITGDLGVIFKPNITGFQGFKTGISAQNITRPDVGLAQTDRVPDRYAFGIGYADPSLRWLNLGLDLTHRNGRDVFAVGYEGFFAKDVISIRAGGSEDALTGGLGYQFKIFKEMIIRLDYALLWPLEVEGSNGSHRFSLSSNF